MDTLETQPVKRGPGRPKKNPTPAMVGLSEAQFTALLERVGGNTQATDIESVARVIGQEVKKARMPENGATEIPRISNYNPLGERDHPRPRPKCDFWMGGAPVALVKDYATNTREELEALNALEPGIYAVEKTDGSKGYVTVEARFDANHLIERMNITFPEGDNPNVYPALKDWPRQCTEATRVQRSHVA